MVKLSYMCYEVDGTKYENTIRYLEILELFWIMNELEVLGTSSWLGNILMEILKINVIMCLSNISQSLPYFCQFPAAQH